MKTFTLVTVATLIATSFSANAIGLDTIDKDDDGFISQQEFLAVFAPDRGIETFNFIDKNNDGMLDTREFWISMMGQGPLKN